MIGHCRERCTAGSPSFLQANEVTAKLLTLRQHMLVMPIPVLPLYSQSAHILGRYRPRAFFCLLSPNVLLSLPSVARPILSSLYFILFVSLYFIVRMRLSVW